MRSDDSWEGPFPGTRGTLGKTKTGQALRHLVGLGHRRPKRDGRAGDPILALSGLGKDAWAGVDPDDYVRGLRAGW